MAQTIELEASAREGTGKGAARQSRRAGNVPGVIYGGGKDPQSIDIKQPVLLKALKRGSFLSTLINLKVGDGSQTVICRAVQRDVVRDLPIHVDFLRLSERSRVNLMIPVHFINHGEAPGLRKGGVLTVVRSEVELRVRADNIPTEIEIDLAGVDISDTIRISDVTLPEGAALTITGRDFMIANISAPSALAASDDEEEGDAVEAEDEDDDEEEAEE